ncbi:MAG: hypothetical protein ACRDJC_14535 [Thermomicrobiales bacterium]
MHHLTALLRRLRREHGFSMPAVMGTMTVTIGLSLVALTAAGGDQHQARHDQDFKRSYAAAEAGINEYLFHLNEDASYWTRCTGVPAPAKINQRGANPLQRRAVPGTDAEYAIELLPQPPATACDPNNSLSMIDPSAGTIRIRSTGFARKADRSLVATFRRIGFVDFLYYTNYETANPVSYRINTGGYPPSGGSFSDSSGTYTDIQDWASVNCGRYYDQRRNASVSYDVRRNRSDLRVDISCTEINFITGDGVDGPLHTNDQLLVCGQPVFGRNVNGVRDKIEAVHPSGWRGNSGCSNNNPNFVGERRFGAGTLSPPSVGVLRNVVDPAYLFTGRTQIELNGSNLRITNGGVTQTVPPPSNGVIFVQNGGGTCGFYDPINTQLVDDQCGDVEIQGTYGFDLTVAAERDVRIMANIQQANGANKMLGLIADNFIRVHHPVTNLSSTYNSSSDRFSWACNNDGGVAVNRIDAAMLSINHSFTVDNYFCGNALGTLTVNGAIAQNYRGTVGTFGSNNTGYIKDYNYDDRLKYRQPPHFLDPIQTGWRVIRQTEQTTAP